MQTIHASYVSSGAIAPSFGCAFTDSILKSAMESLLKAVVYQKVPAFVPILPRGIHFWNQAKRVLRKYNGIDKKDSPLFLKEYEFRFNYGTPANQL